MEEIDTSWLEPLPVSDPVQMNSELEMLRELADNVGCYAYEYKPEYQHDLGSNDQENIGIMAQDLQKIPGLASSVITNEDGSLSVDGNRLALSALAYVAALARHILGVTVTNDSNTTVSDGLQNTEEGTDLQASGEGAATATATGTGSPEISGLAEGSAVQANGGTGPLPTTGLNSNVYQGR
jgi:hypothetical protein